jgi:hypothetical protein
VRAEPLLIKSGGADLGLAPVATAYRVGSPVSAYAKPPVLVGRRFLEIKPMVGFEPTTSALRKPCSTVELHRRGQPNFSSLRSFEAAIKSRAVPGGLARVADS